MGKKQPSKLEKALAHDINMPVVTLLKFEFSHNGFLNAKGRLYFKTALFFCSLIYHIYCESIAKTCAAFSLASIIFPIFFDITSKTAVKSMKLKNGNLYDMLAAAGCYIIMFSVTVPIYIFLFLNRIVENNPLSFEQLINGDTLTAGGIISVIGAMALLLDILLTLRDKIKDKKRREALKKSEM